MTDNEKLLVAAAYRAAAEVCRKASGPQSGVKGILKLTPADAEKALREFGMEVAERAYAIGFNEHPDSTTNIEQIVDEVMKK
jgi:hypothetical protein